MHGNTCGTAAATNIAASRKLHTANSQANTCARLLYVVSAFLCNIDTMPSGAQECVCEGVGKLMFSTIIFAVFDVWRVRQFCNSQ